MERKGTRLVSTSLLGNVGIVISSSKEMEVLAN